MQKDVRFGLILAAAIALACGSKRLSIASPEQPATSGTETAAASSENAKSAAASPLVLPAPPDLKPIDKPAKSGDAKADPLGSALANLFPKDLREKAEQANQKPKSTGEAKPPVKKPTSANGPELTLPDADWLHQPSKGDASKTSSNASLESSDKPKPLPEDKPKSLTKKPPLHPYFQRYLDEGSYFVRDGDTLDDIANSLYQDQAMAADILKANRSLLKSADDLRPGMRLQLPK